METLTSLLFSRNGFLYPIMYPVNRILFKYLGPLHSLEVIGAEHIPQSQALIIVANHRSEFDPWAIGAFLSRPIAWLAKEELYDYRMLRQHYAAEERALKKKNISPWLTEFFAKLISHATVFIVAHAYTLPVDSRNTMAPVNSRAKKQAVNILKTGGLIGIFFQGGIDAQYPSDWFAVLARREQVALLPVTLEKGRIHFHAVITPDAFPVGKRATHLLADTVKKIILSSQLNVTG